jgi:hypothetical protein
MTFRHYWHSSRGLAPAAVVLAVLPGLWAQFGGILTVAPSLTMKAARDSVVSAKLYVQLRNGYHVNSSTPADDYLVPLTLTWNASPLEVREIVYPKPKLESSVLSAKPLSVYTGDFEIVTRFGVPAKAPLGASVITGKLRYQACTNSSCLPPKTVEVRLPVDIQAK